MSKVHTRISAAVLASLVAAAPALASAQDQPAPESKPHHTFDDIDTNKDGMISRAEFDAAHAKMAAAPKAASAEHACGEGKCGEGKCGGAAKKDAKAPPAKTPAKK